MAKTKKKQEALSVSSLINDVLVADEEDFCASCPAFDIRSMEHQELYSRLYMS